MKTCYRCDEVRPVEAFTPGRSMCKPCRSVDVRRLNAPRLEILAAQKRALRAANPARYRAYGAAWRAANPEQVKRTKIKAKYGLAPETYDEMRALQDSRCAICNIHQDATDRGLHVDHNHDTGEVRALLCGPCNTTLGLLKEDPERFRTSAKYLEHFR